MARIESQMVRKDGGDDRRFNTSSARRTFRVVDAEGTFLADIVATTERGAIQRLTIRTGDNWREVNWTAFEVF